MFKVFCLAAALVLLATGCAIPRPNEVRAGQEKKVVHEVVETMDLPLNMRFLQFVQRPSSFNNWYIFEEAGSGGKLSRIVFMEREGKVWRRVRHLE